MNLDSIVYSGVVIFSFLLGMLVMWIVVRDMNINYIRLLNNYRIIAQDRLGIQAILEAVQEEKAKEIQNGEQGGLDE